MENYLKIAFEANIANTRADIAGSVIIGVQSSLKVVTRLVKTTSRKFLAKLETRNANKLAEG